jgi:hypothetical protein
VDPEGLSDAARAAAVEIARSQMRRILLAEGLGRTWATSAGLGFVAIERGRVRLHLPVGAHQGLAADVLAWVRRRALDPAGPPTITAKGDVGLPGTGEDLDLGGVRIVEGQAFWRGCGGPDRCPHGDHRQPV